MKLALVYIYIVERLGLSRDQGESQACSAVECTPSQSLPLPPTPSHSLSLTAPSLALQFCHIVGICFVVNLRLISCSFGSRGNLRDFLYF